MKKIAITLALLILAAGLVACGNNAENQADSPFVPFTENLVLVYELEGPQISDTFLIFNAFNNDGRLQRFTQMGNGDSLVEVVEIIEGRPVVIVGDGNRFSPYSSLLSEPTSMFYVLLPENIEVGARWMAHPALEGDTTVKEITGVDVMVTTPAGTFRTIEIKMTGVSDEEYYIEPVRYMHLAEGIGVVKQRNYSGISAAIDPFTLETAEQDVHTIMLVEILHDGLEGSSLTFHADANGEVPRIPVLLTTNVDLLDVINQMLFDAVYATFGHTLADDVKILSYFANPNTENLHLDFSAGFAREMQAFSSHEAERKALLALVDLFGFFFDAQGVAITVEGQPFAGQFITMRSMEFWTRGGSLQYLPQEDYDDEVVANVTAIINNLRPQLEEAIALINSVELEYLQQFENELRNTFSIWMVEDILNGYVDTSAWLWPANAPVELVNVDDDFFFASVGDQHGVVVWLEDGMWRIDYIASNE